MPVTTAELKTASESYRKLSSKAMTKADPSIAPILDKLDLGSKRQRRLPSENSKEKKLRCLA